MSAERVIDIARGELGYTEDPPSSNSTKYGAAYGWDGVPWCVIFLWWCFREAGERAAFYGGAKTASCGTLLRWYREQGQTVSASEVQPGDIVLLNFNGGKDPEHCGLVIGATRRVDDSHKEILVPGVLTHLFTIEGNTSTWESGVQDNGGMVCQKTRYPSQVVAVCRPTYSVDPPKPDYAGHWAEADIRWCIERGLMTGYEDGSFQPDKPVTRAELAAVLKRLERER